MTSYINAIKSLDCEHKIPANKINDILFGNIERINNGLQPILYNKYAHIFNEIISYYWDTILSIFIWIFIITLICTAIYILNIFLVI